MTLTESLIDATKRGWHVTFALGERGCLVITAEFTTPDNRRYCSQRVLAPRVTGTDDLFLADEIQLATNDRQLPHNQLAEALVERKRRDPDAPDVIAGPLEMLDANYRF